MELCWPEIHQYLESFEGSPVAQGHKEKTSSFVAAFNKDCIKVYENILMNPFSTDSQFCKLNSSYIFPDAVSRDSKRVFVLGENLYSAFLYTRLVVCSDDLNKKKITKNSLKLRKDSDEAEAEKPRISINEKFTKKLRDACNSRSLLAKQVFQGEWTGAPECFVTKECKPYHNTKSAILDCITSDQAYIESQSMMNAIVIDSSVIIRSRALLLSSGSTFDDFSLLVIYIIIKMAESCSAQRIDIVSDQYTELSINLQQGWRENLNNLSANLA